MSEETKLPKPTSFDELFPGRFLKAGQFKGRDVTLTIDAVVVELMPKDKGGEEAKGIIYFREKTKLGQPCQLVLNRTNGECLKAMFGKNIADWNGKRVTLYPGTDKFGRDTVDCIRVRGSPDIASAVTFELKLPKKKGRLVTLHKTGAQPGPQPAQNQVAAPTLGDGSA